MQINMIEDDLSKTEAGDFTTKIWALENRRFYKPTITDRHARTKYPSSQKL